MLIAVVTVLIKICELSIIDPFWFLTICRLHFTAELLHYAEPHVKLMLLTYICYVNSRNVTTY